MKPGIISFHNLLRRLDPQVTSIAVLDSILQYSKANRVLLLVDELSKIYDQDIYSQTYRALTSSVLNNYGQLDLILTTFDRGFTVDLEERAASNRPICWLPLQPLNEDIARSLVLDFFQGDEPPPPVLRMLGECAGHPRSIEAVCIQWKRGGYPASLQNMSAYRTAVINHPPLALPLILEAHVLAALSGQPVTLLKTLIPGTNET